MKIFLNLNELEFVIMNMYLIKKIENLRKV